MNREDFSAGDAYRFQIVLVITFARGKVIASPVDFCREIFQCQQGSLNGAGIAGNGLDLFCREHLPVAGAGAFGLVGRGISFRPVNVERFL